MNHKHRWLLGGSAAVASLGALLLAASQGTFAADHLDPPARTDPAVDPTPDIPADIADVYAWHDGTNAYFSVTFAGPQAAGTAGFYDRDVLYTLNISTAAPGTTPEVAIRWRFGPGTNGTGNGVRFENLPGLNNATLTCRVEQTDCQAGGVRAYAGLRDDPFFFDLQGFNDTVATGTLMFNRARNFFAGKNDTAVVLQIPISSLGSGPIDVWSTTARFGGQL